MTRKTFFSTVAIGVAAVLPESSLAAHAADANVVLVHGELIGEELWDFVVPILARRGAKVSTVQISLRSVAEDAASVRETMSRLKGPITAVGFSYGGAVIGRAAEGMPNVRNLVYVAGVAPQVGETIRETLSQFPTLPSGADFVRNSGLLTLVHSRFREDFCADLKESLADFMAANQYGFAPAVLEERCEGASWLKIPTSFIISENDRLLHPEAQEFYAKRMNATVVRLSASHAAPISHPSEVAEAIASTLSRGAWQWSVGNAYKYSRRGAVEMYSRKH